MKKILFIIMVILCSSCASTYTITTIGNVTAYTSNGDVLRKWEDVKLTESTEWGVKDNSFKTFGYNFYDPYTNNYIVINNAVPCIVEYKVIDDGSVNKFYESMCQTELNNLIEHYKILCYQKNEIIKLMKTMDKNSDDYKNIKENLKGLNEKIKSAEKILWDKYQWSPIGYSF